jgi:hypothetical protein
LLGALYFEKLIRKIKNFLSIVSERPVSNFMLELTEVTQILACENFEEMENYVREQHNYKWDHK